MGQCLPNRDISRCNYRHSASPTQVKPFLGRGDTLASYRGTKRIAAVGICLLLVLWLAALGTDYWRTTYCLARPIFVYRAVTLDDGGSGIYFGPGYSVVAEGNFLPEDPSPGLTYVQFRFWGFAIRTVGEPRFFRESY